MAEFYMVKQATSQQASVMIDVSNSINNVRTMVADVNSGLAGIGIGNVGPALTAIEAQLVRHASTVSGLSSNLNRIVLKYIEAESKIMGISVLSNPDYVRVVANGIENNASSLLNSIANYEIPFIPGGRYTVAEMFQGGYDFINGVIHYPQDNGIGIMQGSISLAGETDWTNLMDMDNPYFDQAETLHMVEVGPSVSATYYGLEGSIDGPYGSLSGNMSVLSAEAHATAYAGLFSTDGHFAPGVGAEIGASATAFSAEGTGRLGNDYLGLYATGGVEVGHVGANAGISAGLYDGDGNFNPSLGASAEAEAILAQASGSAGATVLGTDIGVRGSIGVGAGAHANVGLQDGVLSFEVGAYIGVGGTVGFDIDFNNTYDTMVSAWDNSCDWVCDRASDVADWASDTWDSAVDAGAEFLDWVTFWD